MGGWFDTEKVFSNNGGKIKKFAKGLYIFYLVVFLIAGIFWCIGGLVELANGNEAAVMFLLFGGLVIALAQPLAYLSTCFLHGFGELIANSYSNRASLVYDKKEEATPPAANQTQETVKKFRCPNCKTTITTNDKECPGCGASFDWDKV